MDPQGSFAAEWIGQGRRALAAGAASRLRDRHERLVSEAGELGFPEVIADTEARLEFLAEALAVGRYELFADHLHWLKVSHANRGLEGGYVRGQAEALRDELRESLPTPYGDLAAQIVDDSLRGFDELSAESETLLPDGTPHVELARRYLEAALAGNRQAASELVEAALRDGVSADDLEHWVIMRAQQEIGRMWQVGDVHSADEHFASRIAERLVIRLSLAREPREARGLKVVIASVGGNDHDLATRMLADRFDSAGWSSILLGANMPALDIARSVIDHEADLVALSTALALHVRAAHRVIQTIRKTPQGANLPVLIGGHPFLVVEDLYRIVGADGTATDLDGAVATAEELVGRASST